MPKKFTVLLVTALSLLLSSCSISQQAPLTATPIPPTATAGSHTAARPATPSTQVGNPALPTAQIPLTWSSLHLSGWLVYISSQPSQSYPIMSVQALNLTNGQITTIFQGASTSWIDFASVSPDGKQLLIAYLPPHTSSASSAAQQALYLMPLDGSREPQLLFQPPSSGDQYYHPVWSPDGRMIYFAHFDFNQPLAAAQHYPSYEIERMAYPLGQPQKVADGAYWPRLSADGARLAFVTLDPVSGVNKLFVANPDGSGAYPLAISGLNVPQIIDAPFFTPDDRSVLYSAVSNPPAYQPNWLDQLFGITVAYAHTVPSDWWSVPIGGGTPTQLTHIAAVGLYASLSPDRQHIASYSGNGVFVMSRDGTGLTMLVNDTGGLSGTISWIP